MQAHGAKMRVLSRPEGGAESVLEILEAKAAEEESRQRVAALDVARG